MHTTRELVVKVTLFACIVSAAQCVPMRVMAASEVTSDSTETTQVVSTLSRKERRRQLAEAKALQGQVEHQSVNTEENRNSRVKPGYDNTADLNFGMHPSWMLVI